MVGKAARVMSESNTFDLLNAVDQKLETTRLPEHSRGVPIRLRSILEDDLDAFGRGRRHLQNTSRDVHDLDDLRRTT